MKTEVLIALLARGPIAADRRAPERRLGAAAALGSGVAALAMLVLFGVRADLAAATGEPMFWLKIAFPLLLATAAFAATSRLARPGGGAGAAAAALAATVLVVWAAAFAILLDAPAAERTSLVAGSTAVPCVASVAALALPLLVAFFVALRTLAPTRPRAAGAAAGLLAGALAAAVYAVHCHEMALPFVAVWYVLGMLVPAIVGALVGPRLLRWI